MWNPSRREVLFAAAGTGALAADVSGAGTKGAPSTRTAGNAAPDGLNLKYVTYCGLYCRLCANMARIPQQAEALRATLHAEKYDLFMGNSPEFKTFWKVLGRFCQSGKTCAGCRSGNCGYRGCKVRKCAAAKKVAVCSACADFPCKHFDGLAKRYPNLLADAERQQTVGLAQWIREQDERAAKGFCYADIRCP